jgi:hypothetical protein
MSYAFQEPHPFHAKSKRKPDVCSTCFRSISHPLHQDSLAVEMTAEQRQESDARSAAELSQEMRAPLGSIDSKTGKMELVSPLFANSGASGQGCLF